MSSSNSRKVMTFIRNAIQTKRKNVIIPWSKINISLIEIFHEYGFFDKYFYIEKNKRIQFSFCKKKVNSTLKNAQPQAIYVCLRYYWIQNRKISMFKGLQSYSLQSFRIFTKYKDLSRFANKLPSTRLIIVNTSRGLISFQKTHGIRTGGEILCIVWLPVS